MVKGKQLEYIQAIMSYKEMFEIKNEYNYIAKNIRSYLIFFHKLKSMLFLLKLNANIIHLIHLMCAREYTQNICITI